MTTPDTNWNLIESHQYENHRFNVYTRNDTALYYSICNDPKFCIPGDTREIVISKSEKAIDFYLSSKDQTNA